jgi:murein DD-endopeptidase MepM/ murein hydrolase activator NlpD
VRTTARICLAVVVLMSGLLVLPRPASRVVAPDASAQIPTPTIPDILGSPTPSPDPTKTPDPDPGGGGGGGGGGSGDGGGGGGSDKGGGGDDPGSTVTTDPSAGKEGTTKAERLKTRKARLRRARRREETEVASIAGRIPGAFDTTRLVQVATRLRSFGVSAAQVRRRVYPPFIIAGPASWVDTWGAPRYGPAPGQVRTHEGQDVFCDYGDPVLAPEAGTVDFSDGGLGGTTARVYRPDGSYWYLTHLSDVNDERFAIGDQVETGDVIGYCGNSGNAATTAPHVHFGWYRASGEDARNPMRWLVRWLHTAERRLLGVVTKTQKKRIRQNVQLTLERRFGDMFAPTRSELKINGESLWASGTSPATGAFGLAEAALQEALSANGFELGIVPEAGVVPREAPLDTKLLDPDSTLGQLLRSARTEASHAETGD